MADEHPHDPEHQEPPAEETRFGFEGVSDVPINPDKQEEPPVGESTAESTATTTPSAPAAEPDADSPGMSGRKIVGLGLAGIALLLVIILVIGWLMGPGDFTVLTDVPKDFNTSTAVDCIKSYERFQAEKRALYYRQQIENLQETLALYEPYSALAVGQTQGMTWSEYAGAVERYYDFVEMHLDAIRTPTVTVHEPEREGGPWTADVTVTEIVGGIDPEIEPETREVTTTQRYTLRETGGTWKVDGDPVAQ